MTGHRKWSEIKSAREVAETGVATEVSARTSVRKKISDHRSSLAELRRARLLTQKQLARLLSVSQAQVSRVENQADLYLSTLRSYVEAMGGEIQIRVAFPGSDWTEVTIGDITAATDRFTEDDHADAVIDFVYHQSNSSLATSWSWLGRSLASSVENSASSWLTCAAVLRLRSDAHALGRSWPQLAQELGESQPSKLVTWRNSYDAFSIPEDSERFISSAVTKES